MQSHAKTEQTIKADEEGNIISEEALRIPFFDGMSQAAKIMWALVFLALALGIVIGWYIGVKDSTYQLATNYCRMQNCTLGSVDGFGSTMRCLCGW